MLDNLRKSVEHYRQQLDSISPTNVQQFELLKGLPFYDFKNENVNTSTMP